LLPKGATLESHSLREGESPAFGRQGRQPQQADRNLFNLFYIVGDLAFITYGHHALIAGNRKGAIDGVVFTIILAILFTGLQYFEYSEAGFTMSDSVYGSAFYASTGLHGLHVIVGTIFIGVSLVRLINYQLTTKHHNGFESSILYWHFVDVVWLFLFVAVYFWGNT
jgi:cytochrome c oxidase subunit 3